MDKFDYLVHISRYLHSPVLDMSGGDTFAPYHMRVPEGHLAPFRERSVRTLLGYTWNNDDPRWVKATWDVLQAGGHAIFWHISDDVLKALRTKVGNYEVIKTSPVWVIRKHDGNPGVVRRLEKVDNRPKACIFRHGAYGDMLMITPLVDHLRKEGYHVTVHCSGRGKEVFLGDPRVDDLAVHEPGIFPRDSRYTRFRDNLSRLYDKFVDIHERVEVELLRSEDRKEFHDPWEKRHAECNKNYMDNHFIAAGYPEIKGAHPSIWLSEKEINWAKSEYADIQKKTGKSFIVLWNLHGSIHHKMYPWMYEVWKIVVHNRDDVGFVTVADEMGAALEERRFRNIEERAGKYSFRQTLAMHSVVDGVVTPETNSLIAGLAFPAPIIALLSHSSPEQYSWRPQDIPMHPKLKDCPCYPCHQLHKTRHSCPSGVYEKSATLCMDSITPGDVYESLMTILRRKNDVGNADTAENQGSVLP